MSANLKTIVEWTKRLAPGFVTLSLLFAFEDNLRWLGLFGIVLIVLAFCRDVPNCACSIDDKPKAPTWPSL